MGEKAQRIEPMVERDDDDAARRETRAVIARLGPRADDKPAAVNQTIVDNRAPSPGAAGVQTLR